MNKQINYFFNPHFGEIRTLEINTEHYFVGKDIIEALGYANSRDALLTFVDQEDKAEVEINDGSQSEVVTVINEAGLYYLIFRFTLTSANEFKKWITAEVLPAIRTIRGLMNNNSDDTPETFIARAVLIAKDIIEHHNAELEAQRLQLLEPNVEDSNQTYTTTQIAKELGMSTIALNRKLCAEGIIRRQGKKWVLCDEFQDQGYTTIRKHSAKKN